VAQGKSAKKKTVRFTRKSRSSVTLIALYIAEKGYPETAIKWADNLYRFTGMLGSYPDKYPVCKYPAWYNRSWHCAVFRKDYVIAYRIGRLHVTVMDIVHASRLG
jgi:plasmid stabilization system protein ParE